MSTVLVRDEGRPPVQAPPSAVATSDIALPSHPVERLSPAVKQRPAERAGVTRSVELPIIEFPPAIESLAAPEGLAVADLEVAPLSVPPVSMPSLDVAELSVVGLEMTGGK